MSSLRDSEQFDTHKHSSCFNITNKKKILVVYFVVNVQKKIEHCKRELKVW
jgi:hypothetical protein